MLLEPERVSEKLHQNMFWLGRGGSITHTISGIDIALWDLLQRQRTFMVACLADVMGACSTLCLTSNG